MYRNCQRFLGDDVLSDTKFTPGPWMVHKRNDEDNATLVVSDGENIADCNFFPRKNAHHNAHLIAAAPDLYQALAEIDRWSRRQNIALPTSKVYAALAKARGEL